MEETHDKLLSALAGLDTLKQTYEDHRRRLSEYSSSSNNNTDACLENWEFPPQIIFHRYDRFLARLANIRVCINLVVFAGKKLQRASGLIFLLVGVGTGDKGLPPPENSHAEQNVGVFG